MFYLETVLRHPVGSAFAVLVGPIAFLFVFLCNLFLSWLTVPDSGHKKLSMLLTPENWGGGGSSLNVGKYQTSWFEALLTAVATYTSSSG